MASFAELSTGDAVLRILIIPDDQSHRGGDYLAVDLDLGGRWVPCHKPQPRLGDLYDAELGTFIAPSQGKSP